MSGCSVKGSGLGCRKGFKSSRDATSFCASSQSRTEPPTSSPSPPKSGDLRAPSSSPRLPPPVALLPSTSPAWRPALLPTPFDGVAVLRPPLPPRSAPPPPPGSVLLHAWRAVWWTCAGTGTTLAASRTAAHVGFVCQVWGSKV